MGTGERQAVIECEAFANDEAAALRVRALAMSGLAGNVKLEMHGAQTLQVAAYVTSYREVIQAGAVISHHRIWCGCRAGNMWLPRL